MALPPTLVEPPHTRRSCPAGSGFADRAGLTKRTFFNHFADKREVLFAGAKAFEASIIKHLTEAGDDLAPIDPAVAAPTRGGLAIAETLRQRHVAARAATLTAQMA
jgi:AcrR family transcriptional regulator